MAGALKQQKYTFDDFCVLVRDKQKADLLDGVIYMASPDNLDANRLNLWLGGLVDDYATLRDLGEVFVSRVAFRLDDFSAPEPDIGFVLKERLHLKRRGFFQGAPDLAMEIVSPDSIERDYLEKKESYARFGVLEYWIIDEIKRQVRLFRGGRHGKYREIRTKGGIFHSEVLQGFWLRPAWLWQVPRPAKSSVLQEILEGA
jgi:Uma2 family endonuclease